MLPSLQPPNPDRSAHVYVNWLFEVHTYEHRMSALRCVGRRAHAYSKANPSLLRQSCLPVWYRLKGKKKDSIEVDSCCLAIVRWFP